MTERTLLVYGNCQAGCIAAFMSRTPTFSEAFDIPTLLGIHQMTEADLVTLYEHAGEADVLLSQEVGTNYRGVGFSSTHLASILRPSAQVLYYPSLYFAAYFPNLLYLRDPTNGAMFTGPGGDYHDRDILDSYISKRTVSETSRYLQDESRYDRDSVRKSFEEGYVEMRRRERHIDVKTSDYIADNFADRRLFHVFNHPANEVMFEVCSQVANLFGIPFSAEHLKNIDQWLSGASFPIPPAVHRALGLRFPYDSRFNASGIWNVEMENALEMFFAYYDQTPDAVAAYQSVKHI
jgi:Polysaccharide biosynthesis enzyme WcbI